MIKINVRFVCREIVGDIPDGEYELSENRTVRDLLSLVAEKSGTFAPDYLEHLIYLINYRPAKEDDVLNDNDQLFVLRKASGG